MSMKKNNKTCITCGKVYTFCSGCSQFDHLPRWMGIFHNENCKDIYNILNDYINRELSGITKEDARMALDKCDLSYKEKLHKNLVAAIDEIYVEEKVAEDVVETKMVTKTNKKHKCDIE